MTRSISSCATRASPAARSACVDIGISGRPHRRDRAAICRPTRRRRSSAAGWCCPGFVETHIHLDKSCILDRCRSEQGTLDEAIAAVAAAKRAFTEEDVYARGRRTLEKAILQGTTRMRTHVEVDPRIGLSSFNAISAPEAATTPGRSTSRSACFRRKGCSTIRAARSCWWRPARRAPTSIGGCPYTDTRSARPHRPHLRARPALRPRHRLPSRLRSRPLLDASRRGCRQTDAHRLGRPRRDRARHQAVGQCRPNATDELAGVLADAGVARHGAAGDRPVPDGPRARPQRPARRGAGAPAASQHGVTCSLATNNVLNPFTPFGDCSLIRMANLYANIAQVGTPAGSRGLLRHGHGTAGAADESRRLRHRRSAIRPISSCSTAATAPRRSPSWRSPCSASKRGRRTFTRAAPVLHGPASHSPEALQRALETGGTAPRDYAGVAGT